MRLPITLQNEGAVDKPLAMCKNRASRKTKRSSQGEVQMLSELVEDIKTIEENLKELSKTNTANGKETVINYSIYKVKKSLRNKINEEK